MAYHRRESPIRRVNPSGAVVWLARYTDQAGSRRSAGTFKLKRDAQRAIDAAYGRPGQSDTVGAYFDTWAERHPRAPRTNETNEHRIGRVLDVRVDSRPLREWPFRELKRKHALELVAVMLSVHGRAPTGVRGILASLSAMAEDAITDEAADVNAFRGVRVREKDPRARRGRKELRVFSFGEMRAFARCAGDREAMVRVLSDCGLRLGELLGLERRDRGRDVFALRGSAHNGVFTAGDAPTKRHVREVPIPPGCAAVLDGMPARLDTPLLFATPGGLIMWERNFYRDVWFPAQVAYARLVGVDVVVPRSQRDRAGWKLARGVVVDAGLDWRPHEFRHSWATRLTAGGLDPADVAEMAGHSLDTLNRRYRHPLRRSHGAVRELLG